jgi:hypothetical protein
MQVVPTPIQQGESGDTLRSDPSHPTTAENENSQKELEGIQNPPMDIQSEQVWAPGRSNITLNLISPAKCI